MALTSFSALSVEPSAESGHLIDTESGEILLSVLSLLSRLLNQTGGPYRQPTRRAFSALSVEPSAESHPIQTEGRKQLLFQCSLC